MTKESEEETGSRPSKAGKLKRPARATYRTQRKTFSKSGEGEGEGERGRG